MSNRRIAVQLIDPALPPDGVRQVPELGLTVRAGEIIRVTVDVAGRGPYWRQAVPDDDLSTLQTRTVTEGNASVLEVYDLGYGLLAQTDIWAPATAPSTSLSSPSSEPASPGEEG